PRPAPRKIPVPPRARSPSRPAQDPRTVADKIITPPRARSPDTARKITHPTARKIRFAGRMIRALDAPRA
ncbi:hypothetical protein, partial [Paractinoplanes ferrugineus]